MSQKEELKILRELLWKIRNATIKAEVKIEDNGGDYLKKILTEIRYGYCYNLSNSYEGQTFKDVEKLRIESLNRLKDL